MLAENYLPRKTLQGQNTHLTLTQKILHTPIVMHLHDYYEMEIVLNGTGEQNLNGTIYPLHKGIVYFLTPIDFHSVTPGKDLEIANISFDETRLSPELQLFYMNRRDNFIFEADTTASQNMEKLFSLLQQENQNNDKYSERCQRSILDLLLCTLIRGKTEHPSTYSPMPVQQAMQFVFQHFREQITLDQVARQSGYTVSHFSRLFSRLTGKTFTDFLLELRLNYAKMLLLSTDLSITAIAEKSGFGSISNFHRRFREKCGVSPANFATSGQYNNENS